MSRYGKKESTSCEDAGKSFGGEEALSFECGPWKGRPGAQRGEPGIVQTGHSEAQDLGFKLKQRAKSPRQNPRMHTVRSRAAQEFIVGITLMQTWEHFLLLELHWERGFSEPDEISQ